jgi:hypothetical protein
LDLNSCISLRYIVVNYCLDVTTAVMRFNWIWTRTSFKMNSVACVMVSAMASLYSENTSVIACALTVRCTLRVASDPLPLVLTITGCRRRD